MAGHQPSSSISSRRVVVPQLRTVISWKIGMPMRRVMRVLDACAATLKEVDRAGTERHRVDSLAQFWKLGIRRFGGELMLQEEDVATQLLGAVVGGPAAIVAASSSRDRTTTRIGIANRSSSIRSGAASSSGPPGRSAVNRTLPWK
jgi:hypothetical protein